MLYGLVQLTIIYENLKINAKQLNYFNLFYFYLFILFVNPLTPDSAKWHL